MLADVWVFGFEVCGSRHGVLKFWIEVLGVWGIGLTAWGLGCRVGAWVCQLKYRSLWFWLGFRV